jgi:hypothetical protein
MDLERWKTGALQSDEWAEPCTNASGKGSTFQDPASHGLQAQAALTRPCQQLGACQKAWPARSSIAQSP